MNRLGHTVLISGVALTILAACGGSTGSLSLDYTFGTRGKVQTDYFDGSDNEARGVALQADGKIVVAGYVWHSITGRNFGVARYNVDGSLDTNFGYAQSGIQSTNFGSAWDAAEAVAIQDDGKIIAVGTTRVGTQFDFALARYHTDGSLDTSFGPAATGMVTTSFTSGMSEYATDVALQADGKIVVSGRAETTSGDWDIALARYNTDGSLDILFNFVVACTAVCNGKLVLDLGGTQESAEAVTIDADGKILVAGYTNAGSTRAFMIARFNTNGSLDTAGFGSGSGVVTTNFHSGYTSKANAITLQSDGKILVAGEANAPVTGYDFALARYHSDGTLDDTFNHQSICVIGTPCSGQVMTDFAENFDSARAVVLQSDEKIVLVGRASNSINDDFALARYHSDGSLDTGFGGAGTGTLTTAFPAGEDDEAFDGVVQDDDKIVAVGYTDLNNYSDFALVRYLP